MVKNLWLKVTH